MRRLRWWIADRADRSKWWFADMRDAIGGSADTKVVAAVALVALLAIGGYVVAGKVSQAGAGTSGSPNLVRRVKTVRERVKVRVNGHTVVRWRVRRKVVEAQGHAVMQRQTIFQRQTVRTPGGTKVITRPVVSHRTRVVKVGGETSTVVVPQTITHSWTSTVSRTQTDVKTVTQPVTVVQTQTVISTVTLPGTTVTVTLPVG
jgi:hypothetical protein